jgi:hypothetical protein
MRLSAQKVQRRQVIVEELSMIVIYIITRCDCIGNQSFDDGLGSSRRVGPY